MYPISTKAIHEGYYSKKDLDAIIPPLHLATTFEFNHENDYHYIRTHNPNRDMFEKVMASLDENKYGLAFASGMAAIACVIDTIENGDILLYPSDIYGGTYRYINQIANKHGIKAYGIDFNNIQELENAIKEYQPKLVWLESPTNPLLKIFNISKIAKLAHKYKALLAVDNTFATPALQKPKLHGADIVVHSTTKFINGHSDSLGGVVTTSNEEIHEKLRFNQNAVGAVMSPFDAWLNLRSLKTLEVRMRQHEENTQQIYKYFAKTKVIKQIFYPGADPSSYKITTKQMQGFGSVITIEFKDGFNANKFIKKLKLFKLAEGLGGVESLINHPFSMAHAGMDEKAKIKAGIKKNLFRFSIGIENIEDLITDLTQAMQ